MVSRPWCLSSLTGKIRPVLFAVVKCWRTDLFWGLGRQGCSTSRGWYVVWPPSCSTRKLKRKSIVRHHLAQPGMLSRPAARCCSCLIFVGWLPSRDSSRPECRPRDVYTVLSLLQPSLLCLSLLLFLLLLLSYLCVSSAVPARVPVSAVRSLLQSSCFSLLLLSYPCVPCRSSQSARFCRPFFAAVVFFVVVVVLSLCSLPFQPECPVLLSARDLSRLRATLLHPGSHSGQERGRDCQVIQTTTLSRVHHTARGTSFSHAIEPCHT